MPQKALLRIGEAVYRAARQRQTGQAVFIVVNEVVCSAADAYAGLVAHDYPELILLPISKACRLSSDYKEGFGKRKQEDASELSIAGFHQNQRYRRH